LEPPATELPRERDMQHAPHAHRAGRTVALLALPVLTLVTSAIGAALAPTLLVTAPEVLIALDPRPTNLVLTAPVLSPLAYFGIGIVRWFVADPFLFQLGRERGPAAVAWLSPRTGKAGRLTMRLALGALDRAALLIVFIAPGPLVCLLAGVQQRMSMLRFTIANLAGTVTSLVVLRAFGGRFAAPIAMLTAFAAENVAALTIASSVVVALVLLERWRRRRIGARIASS
jgi:hypothetical protein